MRKISEIVVTEKGNYEYEISYSLKDESLPQSPTNKTQYDMMLNDIEPNYTGTYFIRYPDGKLHVHYVNRCKHGLMKEYYANGKKKYCGEYQDGVKEGMHEIWHENGQLFAETPYVNGAREGVERKWYDNSQIESEHSYSNDKLMDGIHHTYHRNGELLAEANYEDGVRHGLQREWHEDGRLITVQGFYKGGKNGICSKKIYDSESIYLGVSNYEIDWHLHQNKQIAHEALLEILNEEGLHDEWNDLGII